MNRDCIVCNNCKTMFFQEDAKIDCDGLVSCPNCGSNNLEWTTFTRCLILDRCCANCDKQSCKEECYEEPDEEEFESGECKFYEKEIL